ncbi:MAG: hypothetical protein H0Z37_01955 [Firmicutes bacterium]|nr:hypothetical protein [Bacillota bacterium]
MSPSKDPATQVADQNRQEQQRESSPELDQQLAQEFLRLVKETAEQIAREAVRPNLERALAEAEKAAESEREIVRGEIRKLLDDIHRQWSAELQQQTAELTAALKESTRAVEELARSSRLPDAVTGVQQQADALREAAASLADRQAERERQLDVQVRNLEEQIRRLEGRIPDAGRVLDVLSDQLVVVREASERQRQHLAQLEKLVESLGQTGRDVAQLSDAVRSPLAGLDVTRAHVKEMYDLLPRLERRMQAMETEVAPAILQRLDRLSASLGENNDQVDATREQILQTLHDWVNRLDREWRQHSAEASKSIAENVHDAVTRYSRSTIEAVEQLETRIATVERQVSELSSHAVRVLFIVAGIAVVAAIW